jgi:peptide/nickel transport system permease protein
MTETLRRLMRTPQGVLGSALLAGLVLACLLGGAVAPYQPEAMDFAGRFAPPGTKHWFGADQLGRDVLSRLLVGARSTIPLAVAATFSGAAIGACIGTLSAYLGSWWDEAITRTIDAVMAVPHLLLALILVSTLGKGSLNAAFAIAISVVPAWRG